MIAGRSFHRGSRAARRSAIVAPAGPVRLDRLRRGLACLGDAFALRVADSVTAPRAPGTPSYLAAPDEVRIAELTAMLADPRRPRDHPRARRLRRDADPAAARSRRCSGAIPSRSSGSPTRRRCWRGRTHAGVRGIHGPMIAQLADLAAVRRRAPDRAAHRAAPARRATVVAARARLRSPPRSARAGEPDAGVGAGRHAVAAAARRRDRAARGGRRAPVRARSLPHPARADRRARRDRRGRDRRARALQRSEPAERRARSR